MVNWEHWRPHSLDLQLLFLVHPGGCWRHEVQVGHVKGIKSRDKCKELWSEVHWHLLRQQLQSLLVDTNDEENCQAKKDFVDLRKVYDHVPQGVEDTEWNLSTRVGTMSCLAILGFLPQSQIYSQLMFDLDKVAPFLWCHGQDYCEEGVLVENPGIVSWFLSDDVVLLAISVFDFLNKLEWFEAECEKEPPNLSQWFLEIKWTNWMSSALAKGWWALEERLQPLQWKEPTDVVQMSD